MPITREHCFGHCAPFLYKQIPFELRTIDDLSIFKTKLKTNLFEKAYDLENLAIKSDKKV